MPVCAADQDQRTKNFDSCEKRSGPACGGGSLPRLARCPSVSDLQAHIGVRLKAFYDSVLSEPIPDRFAELLSRLDADGASATTQNGDARSKSDGNGSDAPLSGGTDTEVRQ